MTLRRMLLSKNQVMSILENREEIMKQWDKWAKYYKDGGGGSWPRDAFEALLDKFEEEFNERV